MSRALGVRPLALMAMASCVLLAACEFDEKAIGVGTERVAVHGVLDPIQFTSAILVEQMLTGRVKIQEGTYDQQDPIVSAGGVPISGARVTISDEIGNVAVAVEDLVTRGDGKGAGVYRITNSQPVAPEDTSRIRIVPAGQYTLRVETPNGTVVTGFTIVPNVQPNTVNPSLTVFNRDRDSLFLQWGEIELAHRYAVRVESPRGPLVVFVDSLEYLLAGTMRNIYTEGLPSSFVPGFRQVVTVGAVDENFYDYYRSQNSIFTGRGLINHLQGGIGLFGSYVMMRGQTLDVRADLDHPMEAPYTRFSGPGGISPDGFNLYVESGTHGSVRQLSGNWFSGFSGQVRGMIGTMNSQSKVTIALLRGQVATDTLDVLDLTWDGALGLTGTLRSTGQRVDYRRAQLP